jgi:hypothetical protein
MMVSGTSLEEPEGYWPHAKVGLVQLLDTVDP